MAVVKVITPDHPWSCQNFMFDYIWYKLVPQSFSSLEILKLFPCIACPYGIALCGNHLQWDPSLFMAIHLARMGRMHFAGTIVRFNAKGLGFPPRFWSMLGPNPWLSIGNGTLMAPVFHAVDHKRSNNLPHKIGGGSSSGSKCESSHGNTARTNAAFGQCHAQ